jgi:hypothetical protein
MGVSCLGICSRRQYKQNNPQTNVLGTKLFEERCQREVEQMNAQQRLSLCFTFRYLLPLHCTQINNNNTPDQVDDNNNEVNNNGKDEDNNAMDTAKTLSPEMIAAHVSCINECTSESVADHVSNDDNDSIWDEDKHECAVSPDINDGAIHGINSSNCLKQFME